MKRIITFMLAVVCMFSVLCMSGIEASAAAAGETYEERVAQMQKEREERVAQMQEEYEERVAQMQEEYEEGVAQMHEEHEERVAQMHEEHEERVAQMQKEREERVAQMREESQKAYEEGVAQTREESEKEERETFEVLFFVAFAVAILINVALCVFTYRDAKKRSMNAVAWVLATIFLSNGVGFVLYLCMRGQHPIREESNKVIEKEKL